MLNNSSLIHPLYCTRTGVPLGTLNLVVAGGHMPYLSHWKESICYHPFFSLPQAQLISLLRDEWNRLAKDITNETISSIESNNLRVGFVAVLHSLGSIKQDSGVVVLPTLSVVQSNLESLAALAYWQNFLDSKRFSFPHYHISKTNSNSDLAGIGDYLDDCWQRKKDYESGMSEVAEKEKAKIAEKAILAIRNTFLKPVGKKLLWQWIKGNLPKKWEPDSEGWLQTLFMGTISKSLDFELDDITLMEEIIVSSCPTGTGVMFAVRERIEEIKKGYREHYDHFVIEETGVNFINTFSEEFRGTPMPKIEDFTSKGKFYVAKARWDLANPRELTAATKSELVSAKAKLDSTLDLENL